MRLLLVIAAGALLAGCGGAPSSPSSPSSTATTTPSPGLTTCTLAAPNNGYTVTVMSATAPKAAVLKACDSLAAQGYKAAAQTGDTMLCQFVRGDLIYDVRDVRASGGGEAYCKANGGL